MKCKAIQFSNNSAFSLKPLPVGATLQVATLEGRSYKRNRAYKALLQEYFATIACQV